MLVATPRIRNSLRARRMRPIAPARVGAHTVTFSRSES